MVYDRVLDMKMNVFNQVRLILVVLIYSSSPKFNLEGNLKIHEIILTILRLNFTSCKRKADINASL